MFEDDCSCFRKSWLLDALFVFEGDYTCCFRKSFMLLHRLDIVGINHNGVINFIDGQPG